MRMIPNNNWLPEWAWWSLVAFILWLIVRAFIFQGPLAGISQIMYTLTGFMVGLMLRDY